MLIPLIIISFKIIKIIGYGYRLAFTRNNNRNLAIKPN